MPPVAVDHSYVNLSKSEYDSQPSTSQPPVIPARRNKPIRTTDHIATSPVLPDIARRTKTASNIVEGQGRQKEDEEDTYNNQALISDGPSTQPNDELPGNQANGLAASGTKGSNQSVYLSLWDERKAAGDKNTSQHPKASSSGSLVRDSHVIRSRIFRRSEAFFPVVSHLHQPLVSASPGQSPRTREPSATPPHTYLSAEKSTTNQTAPEDENYLTIFPISGQAGVNGSNVLAANQLTVSTAIDSTSTSALISCTSGPSTNVTHSLSLRRLGNQGLTSVSGISRPTAEITDNVACSLKPLECGRQHLGDKSKSDNLEELVADLALPTRRSASGAQTDSSSCSSASESEFGSPAEERTSGRTRVSHTPESGMTRAPGSKRALRNPPSSAMTNRNSTHEVIASTVKPGTLDTQSNEVMSFSTMAPTSGVLGALNSTPTRRSLPPAPDQQIAPSDRLAAADSQSYGKSGGLVAGSAAPTGQAARQLNYIDACNLDLAPRPSPTGMPSGTHPLYSKASSCARMPFSMSTCHPDSQEVVSCPSRDQSKTANGFGDVPPSGESSSISTGAILTRIPVPVSNLLSKHLQFGPFPSSASFYSPPPIPMSNFPHTPVFTPIQDQISLFEAGHLQHATSVACPAGVPAASGSSPSPLPPPPPPPARQSPDIQVLATGITGATRAQSNSSHANGFSSTGETEYKEIDPISTNALAIVTQRYLGDAVTT